MSTTTTRPEITLGKLKMPSMPMPSMPMAKNTMMSGGSKTKKTSKKDSKSPKKSKKSKKPMPKGYAYCMNPKCRKQVKMITEKSKTTKNGRSLLYGEGSCGHTVYRFA